MLGLTDVMSLPGTITDSAPQTCQTGSPLLDDVYNVLSAIQETFNPTTGASQLFDIKM